MNQAIDAPDEMSLLAPRIISVKVPVDLIGAIIGPKGKMINQIQDETGADITIEDDGTVYIGALEGSQAEAAKAMIARLRIVEQQQSFYNEYDTISRYITWITDLPWNKKSEDILDLAHAKQVLDQNHYGLTGVKEEILEFLSIMILTRQRAGQEGSGIIARAPILSLVGLAGVGKTTIAYSIAEALGRKIERIPFGGLGSASQLRGKSRLYSDSEPGMVIKALRRAGTSNPVLLLDEIDKISDSYKGDPASALLEVLDPEQNKAFQDNYLEVDFDLSNITFITTANSLNISQVQSIKFLD